MEVPMTRTLALSLLVLAGCTTRGSVGEPYLLPMYSSPVSFSNGKVDLLFMVDNSSSMEAMQSELRGRFGDLVTRISGADRSQLPLDLHVGVVTSDYGAGNKAGGGCQASPGGQLGHLQAVGAAADPGCQPPLGVPYISYVINEAGSVTTNLPPNQSFVQTFTCMASVGASGCGFEHQLESVYAALHGDASTSGFLRPDAALTVVFVTNEDDGSAPPDVDFYSPTANPSYYGAYDTFRQTQFGIACGGTPLSPAAAPTGPLEHCVPAPAEAGSTTTLYGVQRYIDFFTRPRAVGGVKDNPLDVALVAIAGPPTPVSVDLVVKGTGLGLAPAPAYVPCSDLSDNCIARLQHSCQNQQQPAFFADPAVRLATVVDSAQLHQRTSICGDALGQAPDYSSAMSSLGGLMLTQITAGCLYGAPAPYTHPSCQATVNGQVVTECLEGAYLPCWRLVDDARCPSLRNPGTDRSEQKRLEIANAAPHAVVRASCTVY
jgi:hypothetical protein